MQPVRDLLKLKPHLQLRRMYLADLDQVCKIEAEAYGKVHWTRDNFVSELDNKIAHYLVLEDTEAKEIMGYIGSWLVVDEMHITTVATATKYLRKGVAELLLVHLIDTAFPGRDHYRINVADILSSLQ